MTQAFLFLISIIFNIYFWAVIVRIILQAIRADYYNPLSQLVIKVTDFPLKFFHKILRYKNGIDFAACVLAFLVMLLKVALLMLLIGLRIHPINLLLFAVFDFISQVLNLYFYFIIIVAISSWFSQSRTSPIIAVLDRMTNPILKPIRKIIPAVAGFDFAPLVLIVIIIFLKMLLSQVTLGL